MGSGDAGPISKKSKKTKIVIDIDNCPHPFNLSSLAFSPESSQLRIRFCQLLRIFRLVFLMDITLVPVKISDISRVCNICHYTWDEVCSNNSPVVLRKETKDGPHVGRRYFQCTDRDCNERFFKWLDKGTRRYSTRNRSIFVNEVLHGHVDVGDLC